MKKRLSVLVILAFSATGVRADELSDLRSRVEALESKLAAQPAAPSAGSGWQSGYNAGGGGFFLQSPDKAFALKILGYVQSTFTYWDDNAAAARAGAGRRVSNDFAIRRARMDWLATLNRNTEFFVEFDGGPGTAAPSATANHSDFALVEARLTQRFSNAFSLRLGKYTTPFSSENFRSSRAIDTAERYVALNSLFGLPATDVQFGAMALGNLAKNRLTYYAGVFNGNGRANDNFRDNNSSKEVQGKLVLRPWEGTSNVLAKASFGVGVDWDREPPGQTLALTTLGGARVASLGASAIHGTRLGYSFDFFLPIRRLELRGEGLHFTFDNGSNVDANLYGGFAQASFNVWSNGAGASFAPIVRAETAVISSDITGSQARLNTLTVGWNAWLNPNVRWQLNYIPSSFSSTGGAGVVANQHFDEVISQIQFKI